MREDGDARLGAGPSEYELDRDKRIARNVETLRKLGLSCAAPDGMRAKLSSYRPHVFSSAYKCRKLQKTAEILPAPTRVSKRIRGDAAPGAEENKIEVSKNEAAGPTKAGSRRGLALNFDGAPVHPPLTLRSIGTTVWELGEIYRGPWAQRYWSNTGCLYHHAYPVGYRATKTQFGRTFSMQILAGPQGPIFSVREEESGRTFSGSSPTSPWTDVCLALKTGQRISGPLFFGFSDPITMRAIAAMYNPEELAAAQQGQRVGNKQLTAAERAAKEFSSIEGIGEAVAMALSLTSALGGSQHAGLASLRAWANNCEDNRKQLQHFLLQSEEMPAAMRRWPAWRNRLAHRALGALCSDPEQSECPAEAVGARQDVASQDGKPKRTQKELPKASDELAAAVVQGPVPSETEEKIANPGRHKADKENCKRKAQPAAGRQSASPKTKRSSDAAALGQRGSVRQRKANSKFADFVQ